MNTKSFNNIAVKGVGALSAVLVLAATASVAFASAGTPAVPGNLITNPQMQSATVSSTSPDGWLQGGYGTNTTTYAYPVAGPLPGDLAAQVTLSNYTDGAAEWYYQPVPVTGDALYTFSDSYNSNVESYLIAQWSLPGGVFSYDSIATLPSSNGQWAVAPKETFPAPANATAVTVLHLITNGNGSLSTTNYAFTPYSGAATGQFSKGVVSLTFDDGWTSQFNNAGPILKSAGLPGTFYIITDAADAATAAGNAGNLLDSSGISTSTVTAKGSISWGDISDIPDDNAIYTDPTYQQYSFTDTYTSTTTSTVSVKYCTTITLVNGSCPAASTVTMAVGTLPAGTNAPAALSFLLPTFTTSTTTTVSPISIIQSVSAGATLTASSPSLVEYQQYMTDAQFLQLQSEGNTIDSHTETHPDLDLTTLTDADATTEITDSRNVLLGDGAGPVNGFAYPYGDYNNNVVAKLASSGYTNARTVDIGFNTTGTDPFELKSESIDASTTLPTIESWINDAIANKWYLVITMHDVDPANVIAENAETYGITPDLLQQVVSYLSSQESAGNVLVQTPDQVATQLTGTIATPPVTPPATSTPTTTPAVQIIPVSLSDGTVGANYNQDLTASTTAIGVFTWSVSGGALPDGLMLNATTTAITGVPTTAGASTFNLTTTNGSSSVTQSFTLTIDPAATAPGGGSTSSGGGSTGGGSNVVISSSGGGGGGGGGGGSSSSSNTTTTTIPVTTPATGGQVLGASTYHFTRNLSIGMSGPDVLQLQQILIADGFLKVTAATNYFGKLTQAAVKLFQKAHNLPQVGSVGPLTRAILNQGSVPTSTNTSITVAGPSTVAQLTAELNALLAELKSIQA